MRHEVCSMASNLSVLHIKIVGKAGEYVQFLVWWEGCGKEG
jgi:hypothetical protein